MNRAVRLSPCPPISASIRPPGSKSITNRALVCAALANGRSRLRGVLDSEDTQVMIAAWQRLGLEVVHETASGELQIEGCGGVLPRSEAELFVGNSGTTIRFLTAALAACGGNFRLDGVARMRERPIGDLLRALQQLGCVVRSSNQVLPECPPVEIRSTGMSGGRAVVAGNISSQYLSGIMLAAPQALKDVHLVVEGELVSKPYVHMTAEVMRAFGAAVEMLPSSKDAGAGSQIIDASHKYVAAEFAVEPDASAASYFWASAAIAGGTARVEGLSRSSLQGDVAFCEVLAKMGCKVNYGDDFVEVTGGVLTGVDVDMSAISDTVQTLAAVALFSRGATRVTGVAHNRVKETDRIADLATELRRLGADVTEVPDGLTIMPPKTIVPCEIETYQDHRMAMSLALVGLREPGILIKDPQCTAKTYPGYWEDLQSFSGCRIERLD